MGWKWTQRVSTSEEAKSYPSWQIRRLPSQTVSPMDFPNPCLADTVGQWDFEKTYYLCFLDSMPTFLSLWPLYILATLEGTMTSKLHCGKGGFDGEGPSVLGQPRESPGYHLISLCEPSVCREFTTPAEIIAGSPGCIFRRFTYTCVCAHTLVSTLSAGTSVKSKKKKYIKAITLPRVWISTLVCKLIT